MPYVHSDGTRRTSTVATTMQLEDEEMGQAASSIVAEYLRDNSHDI
jgi:hypothetical protein